MNDNETNSVRSIRDVREQAESLFADWVQIVDNKSKRTIEDFPYDTGVPDRVEGHCWRCVTVNYCWFANEKDKLPDEFDYGKYSSSQISEQIRGLYHPHCHCKKFPLSKPQSSKINLVKVEGKIDYMWRSKMHLFHKWGYTDMEKDAFVEMLAQKTKESYSNGNYEIEKHDNHGVKINCIFKIPSKNPQLGTEIEMWSNWMIFPNGTLKCNSFLGGWTK
ncbi:MAG: hypothetical protein NC099_03545 [Corallococcus sp.]|nr:hypothetical protein [Corallococcus sp.]